VWTPRDVREVKTQCRWRRGTAFGEKYGRSFGSVDLEFPFSEVAM
jgi:hypothetical protein